MKQPSKFISALSSEQYVQLETVLKESKGADYTRIKAILLSSDRYSINEIADILSVQRDTVSKWIKLFENDGIDGLKRKSGSGRPNILTENEQKKAIEIAKKHPKSIKSAINEIKKETKKEISTWTLKRLIKKTKMKWKRVRTSLKSKQDPIKVEQAKKDIAELKKLEKEGEINRVYFDESGFDLTPSIPYAWQDSGRDNTIQIPSSKSKRINVLGFMDEQNNLVPFVFENSIDSCIAIACFDKFSQMISSPTVVIIDNAPIHTSNDFLDNIEKWQEKGLYPYFIPPYSPEFNKIEILWRKMKYEWMPFSAYKGIQSLRNAVHNILIGFGSIYKINFA
jgi:transposase